MSYSFYRLSRPDGYAYGTKPFLKLASVLVLALFVSACEDDPDDRMASQDPLSPGSSAANYGASGFGIMPGSATISAATTRIIQFEAISGSPPYTWRVSRSDLGTITASGLYTSNTREGINTITVTDSRNASVRATVTQTSEATSTLRISPSSSDVPVDRQYQVQFQVSGGVPPYAWSVSQSTLGTIDGDGLYTSRTISGANTVFVRDGNGSLASALINQR